MGLGSSTILLVDKISDRPDTAVQPWGAITHARALIDFCTFFHF